jgi:hypothetical protein
VNTFASSTFNGFLSANTLNVTSTATIPSSLIIPTSSALTTTGQIKVDTVNGNFSFYDGTAARVLNPEKCFEPSWTLENPTTAEDDVLFFNRMTSTITRLYSVQRLDTQSTTFNIIWATSRQNASSTARHLFNGSGTGGNVTSTATTTPDIYPTVVAFASTTIDANMVVRIITSAASSSQWSVGLCYRENP